MSWLQHPPTPPAWLETLGWTLLHSLWELSAIAAVAFLALVILRRQSAHLRYVVACVLFVFMMGTTVGTYAHVWSQRPRVVAVAVSAEVAPSGFVPPPMHLEFIPPTVHAPAPSLRERGLSALHLAAPYAASLYLAGAALVALRLLGGYAALRRFRVDAIVAPEHQTLLEELCRRLEIRKTVQLLHSQRVEVPTVFGAWRPLILLPLTTTTGLSAEHLTCLLLHELAHVRRHDYVANLVQSVIETLLFYHPAVWWLSRVVRQEREHCCDDVAIAVSGHRSNYASALMTMESLRSISGPSAGTALATGAAGGSLLARIRRIRGVAQPRAASNSVISGFSLAVIASVVVGSVVFLGMERNSPQAAAAAPSPTTAAAPSLEGPVQIGDVLAVFVDQFLEPGSNYADRVDVGEDGGIQLPRIGEVPVVGKTPHEIADAIVRAAAERLQFRDARVRVLNTGDRADTRPLQSGDRISVSIFELNEVGKMARFSGTVNENGTTTLMQLGSIRVAGLTLHQASAKYAAVVTDEMIIARPAYACVRRNTVGDPETIIASRQLTVGEDVLTAASIRPATQAVLLSDAQLTSLLESAERDPRTISTPTTRFALFHGQAGTFQFGDTQSKNKKPAQAEITVRVQPSADQKSLTLHFESSIENSDAEKRDSGQLFSTSIVVPNRRTVMIRWPASATAGSPDKAKRCSVMLIRPAMWGVDAPKAQ